MIRLSHVDLSIAGRPILRDASVTIPDGHRVGVVGRNGAGKSTLFRLLQGELSPERGEVELPAGARIGHLAQEAPGGEAPLLAHVLAADGERARLLEEAGRATDPGRIAEIQTRLSEIDAWSAEARASRILRGLGFASEELSRPLAAFSGGWRMRAALAALLFSQPEILLLDEPTNHLDLEATLWLERHLARYPGTLLVISHDRDLLTRVPESILHLEGGRLTLWRGNLDAFRRARAARDAEARAAAARQAETRARIERFVNRFRAKASKARQAQSRLKLLARMDPVELPSPPPEIRFAFPDPAPLSPPLIAAEDASVGYDGRPVLRGLSFRIDEDDRIALLGRNGEGKTTLARLIAGELRPMAGQLVRARRLHVGHFAQHQIETLDPQASPLEHLVRLRPREGEAALRARLGGFGLDSEAQVTAVARLSGGQRTRLALLIATLDAPQLLVLDEPTNHLDIESREALADALNAYGGAVVLVSHDLHLLRLVADRLWLVHAGRMTPFDGDLDAYRDFVLASSSGGSGEARQAGDRAARRPRPDRSALQALRAEARKRESWVEKLTALVNELEARLADPTTYEGAGAEIVSLQRRLAEAREKLEKAEELWLAVLERLENAQQGSEGG